MFNARNAKMPSERERERERERDAIRYTTSDRALARRQSRGTRKGTPTASRLGIPGFPLSSTMLAFPKIKPDEGGKADIGKAGGPNKDLSVHFVH